MKTISIRYIFTLKDGSNEVFNLNLDERTLQLIQKPGKNIPSWTRLDFHQCPHCPLDVKDDPNCPLALNLMSIVNQFKRIFSYDEIRVKVITNQRIIAQNTTAQEGISSLMGLVIATSSCPHTDFFKPMARFHLPFANEEETIWRATATYLIVQYFLVMKGHRSKPDPEGLTRIYDNIEKLNVSIVKRLRAASKKDSAVNALVHLDVFAKHLAPGLKESLNSLRPIFMPFVTHYLNDQIENPDDPSDKD